MALARGNRRRTALLFALPCALTALLASSVARADDADELAELLDEHVVNGASKSDEVATDEPPAPKPAKKRGRASVPSWDEIMFGGGKND